MEYYMTRFGRTLTSKTLQDAILDLNEDESKQLLDEKLAEGENPQKILNQIRQGINRIIQRYNEGVIGIVELAMASRILQECLISLKGWYEGIELSSIGRAVIGTIQSDREDIGHKLISTMLFAAGFDTYSIGGNASAELFVNKAEEVSPELVVLMGLDEDSIETIQKMVNSIKKSGISSRLIVGPRIGMSYIFNLDDDLHRLISADAFISEITEVVELSEDLIKDR